MLFAAAAAAAGCATGPVTVPVSGRVTLDGDPLPDADITLFAADNSVSADAGVVRDGAFRFEAKPGPKRVEIVRTVGRADGSVRNGLPDRYGGPQSVLKMDVTPSGPNEFTFELKSK
jgi:hypothetical protein